MSNKNKLEVPIIIDRKTLYNLREMLVATASGIGHERAMELRYYDTIKNMDFLFRFAEACADYAAENGANNFNDFSAGQLRARILTGFQDKLARAASGSDAGTSAVPEGVADSDQS